jgi:glycosyltransferase involved in cell wall biosynthesis
MDGPDRGSRVPSLYALQVASVRGLGGITTAVRHYARMFRAIGISSACVYRGPGVELLRGEGIDVIEAPRGLTSVFGGFLPQDRNVAREIAARASGKSILAVVHSDLALAAIRRMFSGAMIVTPCHSDKAKRKRRADLVVTLNPTQHALISAALAGSPARVAMLGNPFVSPLAAPPSKAPGPPRLNFVGRFTETKNASLLLQALAHMGTRPFPELRLIGEGPLEGRLREEARQAPAKVTFSGWMREPLADFHAGDLLVVTSTWEGAPYLLQEVLDAEVPVVSSDVQGSRTVLGDGAYGRLYPPGDAAALGATIDAAIADFDALRRQTMLGRQALHAAHGPTPFWEALIAAVEATPSGGRAAERRVTNV